MRIRQGYVTKVQGVLAPPVLAPYPSKQADNDHSIATLIKIVASRIPRQSRKISSHTRMSTRFFVCDGTWFHSNSKISCSTQPQAPAYAPPLVYGFEVRGP